MRSDVRYDVIWNHNGNSCAGGFVAREEAIRWMNLHCGQDRAHVIERAVKAWEVTNG
jgi:hypothetical protein